MNHVPCQVLSFHIFDFALYSVVSGLCSQEEERLVRDLFRNYNKLIRPVRNMTQKVEVSFGLAFIQLINVVSLSSAADASSRRFHYQSGCQQTHSRIVYRKNVRNIILRTYITPRKRQQYKNSLPYTEGSTRIMDNFALTNS